MNALLESVHLQDAHTKEMLFAVPTCAMVNVLHLMLVKKFNALLLMIFQFLAHVLKKFVMMENHVLLILAMQQQENVFTNSLNLINA
jgi:hypothetical protein